MGGDSKNYGEFVSLNEASLLCDYTSGHLSRLIRSGKIKGKRVGHRWLVSREDLARYLGSECEVLGNLGEEKGASAAQPRRLTPGSL